MRRNNIPVTKMYDQRHKFVIIALTGITGSGCSDFASLLTKQFTNPQKTGWGDDAQHLIRTSDDLIHSLNLNSKRDFIFNREFETCRKFCSKQYKEFKVIKCKNVVIFYTLLWLANNCASYEDAKNKLQELIDYKFNHSYDVNSDEENYEINKDITLDRLLGWGYTEELYNKFADSLIIDGNYDNSKLANLFFDSTFLQFTNQLYEYLKSVDYYSKNFFVHRLAAAIRATGNPTKKYNEFKDDHSNEYIFALVDLINHIIKGFHLNNPNESRRFVIDSIRNSLEILYLRERYNAFYMIAMHNDGHEEELVYKKVSYYARGNLCKQICRNIMALSKEEAKTDDFEDGSFYSPDIARCVSESELHVAYKSLNQLKMEDTVEARDITTLTFYSYTEQWMKIFSLISRPGIITPSKDERCMSIAYVAKFNSGCISRQVGCAIVDKENAVQSVGWNDPPASHIPCNMRYADELIDTETAIKVNGLKDNKPYYRVYSQYELSDKSIIKQSGKCFCGCMEESINPNVINALSNEGLNYPYCFRSRYNDFMKNKDGVNTRSLHAEENTMLRIAHRGGVGLDEGTMYVTASPCVLCSKKAYQIGIKDIVYLDPYTDIAPDLILKCGFDQPRLRVFTGAIGSTFYKLYQPFLPYKDELKIWELSIKKEY